MPHLAAAINHENVVDAGEGQNVTLALPEVAGGEDLCYALRGASVARSGFAAHQSIPGVVWAMIEKGTLIPVVGIVISSGRMINLRGMQDMIDTSAWARAVGGSPTFGRCSAYA